MTKLGGRRLFGEERQALDAPREMVDGAGGGEDDGAAGSEGETYQALAGDFEIGQAVGRDLHDAARAGERGGDVEVAVDVEGKSLRPVPDLYKRW